MFDIQELRDLLEYDNETGKLYWKPRSIRHFPNCNGSPLRARNWWNARYAGKEAMPSLDRYGYAQGAIFNKRVRAHRVVWAIVHGHWPSGSIDHINGDTQDNRIENLREVTNQENQRNRALAKNNKTGVLGVNKSSCGKRWHARIGVDYRTIHLGTFPSFDLAVKARISAERRHGFHPNHGRAAMEDTQ